METLKNIVVVTASIDEPKCKLTTPAIDRRADGVRYVAFVDKPTRHDIWECVVVDRVHDDPCRDAKRFKVLLADAVPDADASIWIDRHCRLTCDPLTVWDDFDEGVAVVNHSRRCVYHEATACLRQEKDDPATIEKTMRRWTDEGVPRGAGLFYGGFVMRRHPVADAFSRLWWAFIEFGSRRDQLTLPVALRRSRVAVREYDRSRRPGFFMIGAK